MTRGSLTVVGTGIQAVAHTTIEARAYLEQATTAVYLVTDPATEAWVQSLNPNAESLIRFYLSGRPRAENYREITAYILSLVRAGHDVVAAFYGHPGVFVDPSHEAIRKARAEGFRARMLPGISAEDCLFADLGVDPGREGCQSFEATSFLLRKLEATRQAPLILWQIGAVGVFDWRPGMMCDRSGLTILRDRLLDLYPSTHPVTVYQAAVLPGVAATIETVSLSGLAEASVSPLSTLYVPASMP